MAHEIAHQWFGDAVTEKSFDNLWLSEGFATYLTNYYLENKYGIDTLKNRLAADRIKVLKFEKERLRPVVDTTARRNYMLLLNPTSYEKGGWVLHMLRRKLGDAVFWRGIRNYFAKYNGGNANTTDFRKVMEAASRKNLQVFFKQWLYTAGHPDLDITWKYDAAQRTVNIQVNQKQMDLYSLPLEVMVDNNLYTLKVNHRAAAITIPAKHTPPVIKIDPNVNLLAGFTVTGD
jgi:aminopeptidase N